MFLVLENEDKGKRDERFGLDCVIPRGKEDGTYRLALQGGSEKSGFRRYQAPRDGVWKRRTLSRMIVSIRSSLLKEWFKYVF